MKTTALSTAFAVALLFATSPLINAQPNPDHRMRPQAKVVGCRAHNKGRVVSPAGQGGFAVAGVKGCR